MTTVLQIRSSRAPYVRGGLRFDSIRDVHTVEPGQLSERDRERLDADPNISIKLVDVDLLAAEAAQPAPEPQPDPYEAIDPAALVPKAALDLALGTTTAPAAAALAGAVAADLSGATIRTDAGELLVAAAPIAVDFGVAAPAGDDLPGGAAPDIAGTVSDPDAPVGGYTGDPSIAGTVTDLDAPADGYAGDPSIAGTVSDLDAPVFGGFTGDGSIAGTIEDGDLAPVDAAAVDAAIDAVTTPIPPAESIVGPVLNVGVDLARPRRGRR